MINNVKHAYNEVKIQNKQTIETQTENIASLQDLDTTNVDDNKPQIQLKIEETVAVVSNTVSKLMTPKKKEHKEETEEPEEKSESKKTEKKTEEKK
jgi:hypothetical protein